MYGSRLATTTSLAPPRRVRATSSRRSLVQGMIGASRWLRPHRAWTRAGQGARPVAGLAIGPSLFSVSSEGEARRCPAYRSGAAIQFPPPGKRLPAGARTRPLLADLAAVQTAARGLGSALRAATPSARRSGQF